MHLLLESYSLSSFQFNRMRAFEKKLVPVNYLHSIFALPNTSILFHHHQTGLASSLSIGIILGLVVEKPLGNSLAVISAYKIKNRTFVYKNQRLYH